ncbi:MAG: hypothetical protein WA102_11135 [Candidatus Methanoperedens sp.]
MKASEKVKVLWIDDEVIDHTEDAKNLEGLEKNLKVSMVHPDNLSSELKRNKLPDIFLVDYFLDQVSLTGTGGVKYDMRGLAAAGKIREVNTERPIYVVTNKETQRGGIFVSGAQAANSAFDKKLTFKEVQREGQDILYHDALDYRLIRESPRGNLKVLFKLLQVPVGVQEKLGLVLPDELRKGLSPLGSSKYPEGNPIAFAKWVRQILLRVPGFLYDEIHAATYMGMSIEAFKEVSSKFKKAKYSGVFARTAPPLWWVSGLTDIIFSKPKAQKIGKVNPWEVAPMVFKIPKTKRAKCAVCNDLFPETVGINLNDDTDLKPVHYRCSKPYLVRKRELYFDEPRVFEIGKSPEYIGETK